MDMSKVNIFFTQQINIVRASILKRAMNQLHGKFSFSKLGQATNMKRFFQFFGSTHFYDKLC